jgi:hypothetical protein
MRGSPADKAGVAMLFRTGCAAGIPAACARPLYAFLGFLVFIFVLFRVLATC